MQVRRRLEVLRPRDEGHALVGIVMRDAEMVARRHVLARQHHVAEALRGTGDAPLARLLERQRRPQRGERAAHVEPQRVAFTGLQPALALLGWQRAAGARIDRAAIRRVRRGARGRYFPLNVGARAEAGVEQAASGQGIERGGVVGHVFGLHPYLTVPGEPEPGQVLADRAGELGAAAAGVDILQAQEEAPARQTRGAPGVERGMGVAEMEQPGRARGEAGDDVHHAGLS